MNTREENVASLCNVLYLEFSVPDVYANYQQKAKREL